jgi:hypothetical protein
MNWDQAERELLALVKDSRKKLLDQHGERSRGELQAAILTMIHEEIELLQRRAAAGQCALLLDPGATEQKLADELLGYGVLASLMRNPSVSTIIVNAPTRVFTVSDGIMRRERFVRFESDEPVRELVKRHAAAVGRRFDEGSPRVDLGLPDGSRLHALMPPLTTQYTPVDDSQVHPVRQAAKRRGRTRQHARQSRPFHFSGGARTPEHHLLGQQRRRQDDSDADGAAGNRRPV